MSILTNEDKEFFNSLSDGEWEDAESIAWLGEFLWGKAAPQDQVLFVRSAMERLRINPDAKAGEVLDVGLAALGLSPITRRPKRKPRGKLSGAGA